MQEEHQKNDIEIRERLGRVEGSCKLFESSLDRIEALLIKRGEHDALVATEITLNSEHRKTAKTMILSLWASIIGIIATWVTTK